MKQKVSPNLTGSGAHPSAFEFLLNSEVLSGDVENTSRYLEQRFWYRLRASASPLLEKMQ